MGKVFPLGQKPWGWATQTIPSGAKTSGLGDSDNSFWGKNLGARSFLGQMPGGRAFQEFSWSGKRLFLGANAGRQGLFWGEIRGVRPLRNLNGAARDFFLGQNSGGTSFFYYLPVSGPMIQPGQVQVGRFKWAGSSGQLHVDSFKWAGSAVSAGSDI